MGMRVTIRGSQRIIDNMDEFKKKILKATHKAMVTTALIDIESVAKSKLTSDGHIDTGRLRSSIHTAYPNSMGVEGQNTHNYTDRYGTRFMSRLDVDSQQFQVVVGTTVEYGVYIENMDSFLFYAFNKSKTKFKKRMKKEIGKILRR